MRKTPILQLLLILAAFSACGAEKSEAVRFCRILNQHHATIDKANAEESSLMVAIGRWASDVAFSGGSTIKKNVSTAKVFAEKVDNIRAQVAATHQALEDEVLDYSFNQTIRSNLVTSLKSRERSLKEVKELLEQSAEAFPQMEMFTYPGSVSELISRLQSHSAPEDLLADAIKEVRTKFNISDRELSAP